VGYWKLDEATGMMAADSSGQKNDGTYEGAPMSSKDVPAKIMSSNPASLTFANTDAVVVQDSPSLSIKGPLTLAAWIKPTADITTQRGLIEKWEDDGAGNTSRGYYLRFRADKKAQAGIRGEAGSSTSVNGTSELPMGAWSHVAAVFDGTSLHVYVNGAEEGVGSVAFTPTDGSSTLEIGRRMGSGTFEGGMDDVRVYNRALSAAEIMGLANGQR
jgi:hypothetical protein